MVLHLLILGLVSEDLRHSHCDVVLFAAQEVIAGRWLRSHGLTLVEGLLPLGVERARVVLILAEDIGCHS